MSSTGPAPQIALTFDYELFLGKDSGTAERTLLGPTGMVLDLLEKHKARAIFFVDALYILALKNHNHPDYPRVVEQLQRIIRAGSDIQLHIHPQWLDGIMLDEKRWTFSKFDTFRLHAVEKHKLDELFGQTLAELHGIIQQIRPAYRICAFRAGGWSLQPFEYVRSIFEKYEIRLDFSVNPGEYKNNLPEHFFDYRTVPPGLDHYFFSADPTVPEPGGAFLEIPLSRVSMFKGPAFWDWKKVCKEEQFSDGIPLVTSGSGAESKRGGLMGKIKSLFQKKLVALSLEDHTLGYFTSLMSKMEQRPGKLLTAIGHPKNLSPSGVNNIEFLITHYDTVGITEIQELFFRPKDSLKAGK